MDIHPPGNFAGVKPARELQGGGPLQGPPQPSLSKYEFSSCECIPKQSAERGPESWGAVQQRALGRDTGPLPPIGAYWGPVLTFPLYSC